LFHQSKIRILPIFIFVAVLTLTVRVNSVFDVLKGQNESKITVEENVSYAQEEKSKTLEEELKGELDNKKSKSIKDVAASSFKRAEKKTGDFSSSELQILQSLANRREKLIVREKEIERKLVQLEAAEKQIDGKIARLKNYEEKLQKLIGKYNEGEKKKSQNLVKMYSTMKPKDAARIFNSLDMDILLTMFRNMKPSTASAVLSKMNSNRAKEITAELAGNVK